MRIKNVQPAKINYFFEAAYKNLVAIYTECFCRLKEAAIESRNEFVRDWNASSQMKDRIFSVCNVLGRSVALAVMYTFGSALFSLMFVLQGLVLLPISFVIFTTYMCLRAYDRLHLVFKRIFVACPKCKEKSRMPVYICKCGKEHTKLYPGRYGVFKRTCQCGNKLPTMNVNGRGLLKAKCPHCSHPIKGKEAVPICIPVIGSRSSGKTSYISAVMNDFVNRMSPITDKKIVSYDDENERTINDLLRYHDQGIRQQQTMVYAASGEGEGKRIAINFFLQDNRSMQDKLLYIYDIAGESFQDTNTLLTQKQYSYCHGFVLIIDPLTIMSVKEKYKDAQNIKSIEETSGTVDINDTVDAFLLNMKRVANLSANETSKVPCAIVINKIDEFDLEQQLGQPAVDAYMKNPNNKLTDKTDIIDYLVREFFTKNRLTNFMSQIETTFKNCKCFTCSCQGHVEDGTSFEAIRVFEPMQWILSHNDRRLGSELHKYVNGTFRVRFPKKKFNYSGTSYCVLSEYSDGDDTYYLLTAKQGKMYSAKPQVMKRTKLRDASLIAAIKRLPVYDFKFVSKSDFTGDLTDKEVREKLNIDTWKKRLNYVAENLNK